MGPLEHLRQNTGGRTEAQQADLKMLLTVIKGLALTATSWKSTQFKVKGASLKRIVSWLLRPLSAACCVVCSFHTNVLRYTPSACVEMTRNIFSFDSVPCDLFLLCTAAKAMVAVSLVSVVSLRLERMRAKSLGLSFVIRLAVSS